MKKLLVLICLSLSSCYTAPDLFPVDNSKVYNMPYNKVWERVVEYFAVSNTPIQTIEKDSGVIYAEADFFTNDVADCGSMGREKITTAYGIIQHNVFIKKIAKNKTKVLVNLRLSQPLVEDPLRQKNTRILCVSNGETEKNILDYVENPRQEVIFKFKDRD